MHEIIADLSPFVNELAKICTLGQVKTLDFPEVHFEEIVQQESIRKL